MNKRSVLRMTTETYSSIGRVFAQGNSTDEQFALALAGRAEGVDSIVYLLREVLRPEPGDLAFQGPGGVGPTRSYQTAAYTLAEALGMDVVDIHTHPHQNEMVRFSAIDNEEGGRNAAFVCESLSPPSTMLMLVFNHDLTRFDARVLDRETRAFQDIDVIEVLGPHIQFLDREPRAQSPVDERFARHLLIPGWEQHKLGRLKVVVVGLGGNGQRILMDLINLGVGREGGWIAGCDPDVVEDSNQPRLPCAYPSDEGQAKTVPALRYGELKDPAIPLYGFQCDFEDPDVLPWFKECHVIISAVDDDHARRRLNELACRYLVPVIDTAAEVVIENDQSTSLSQVRVIAPGSHACLLCSGQLDLSGPDYRTLPAEARRDLTRAGYVPGLAETPAASVLDVNEFTSALTISTLRRMVFGEYLANREFVSFDSGRCTLVAAPMPDADPDCPHCGPEGAYGWGDCTPTGLADPGALGSCRVLDHDDPQSPPLAAAEPGEATCEEVRS